MAEAHTAFKTLTPALRPEKSWSSLREVLSIIADQTHFIEKIRQNGADPSSGRGGAEIEIKISLAHCAKAWRARLKFLSSVIGPTGPDIAVANAYLTFSAAI